MIFSVLTPTYNRAHTLPMVYEALCAQTFTDFEWLIMDDGSSDQTEQLINAWMSEGKLAISYFKQPNGGKHRALNPLIQYAKGDFSIIVDSDDALTPNALELLLSHWHNIPEEQRSQFAGVSAMCQSQTGKLLGLPIPEKVLDATNLEILYIYKLSGDRKGFVRSEILKQHPFPEYQGEKFLTESIIWQTIGFQYKTRYVSEVVCITDYLEDGLTENHVRHLRENPKGTTAYYRNTLDAPIKLSLKVRAGLHAYYVRYSLHAGYSLAKIIKDGTNKPFLMAFGLLTGPLFYLRDKYRHARNDKKTMRSAKPLAQKISSS
ncbi:MAG: glycosyltransferase family 2 protein [Trueperaceae bacterium]|nr:glycosyltransferase family 2 protein [Trueperaceae bacterium]